MYIYVTILSQAIFNQRWKLLQAAEVHELTLELPNNVVYRYICRVNPL